MLVAGFLGSTGLAHADTDYLGPVSVPDQGFGTLSNTTWLVAEFTVTEARTVTGGAVVVGADPATAATKQIVFYSAVNEAAPNWPTIGTLAQSSFEPAPDIAANRWRVRFTGSVALTPGVYFVGARELAAGGGLNLILATGSQASHWQFTKVGGAFQQYATVNGGATWFDNDFGGVGMITLSGASPASGGDPSSWPRPVLQQVGVPVSGSCVDVDDSELGWGTGLTGGWGTSWAEWRNGPVCTRTLRYGAAGWHVG